MISWARVRERFFVDKSQALCERDGQRELWSMAFLSAGDRALSKMCLYVMFAHDVEKVELRPHMSLVLIGEPGEAALERLETMDNCLWIHDGPEALHVYSELTDIMSEQYQVGYLMYRIHDHIYRDHGVQELVDEIAGFFKLPVGVMDSAFRLIARSDGAELDGLSLEERSERLILMLEQHDLLESVVACEEPMHARMKDSMWFVPIFMKRAKVAYLVILEQDEEQGGCLEERHVYALSLIAEALSVEISKGSFYLHNKGTYFAHVLTLMLERKRVDTEDIRQRLRIFGYDLRDNLYLLCLRLPHGASSGLTYASLCGSLRETFANSFYVKREQILVFLISRNDDELPDEEELLRWEQTLASYGLHAGYVGPFEGAELVRKNMRLAKQALAVGDRQVHKNVSHKSLYHFEDCQVDALLTSLGAELEALDYCYAPLMALLEYDREHDTELTKTLEVHLRHPQNVARTCSALLIDEESLRQRLDFICSVMGTDIVSAEDIMRIQLTLHILDLVSGEDGREG
ncbi:MAG: helix-turn-helix domain-containing protein [Coriobacteriales bacterium]|nr:helix-turn-helix domain-containing protein [Coriobacteriales bacterium]